MTRRNVVGNTRKCTKKIIEESLSSFEITLHHVLGKGDNGFPVQKTKCSGFRPVTFRRCDFSHRFFKDPRRNVTVNIQSLCNNFKKIFFSSKCCKKSYFVLRI